MVKKIFRPFLYGFFLILGGLWITHTPSGLYFSFWLLKPFWNATLSFQDLKGSFKEKIIVESFKYRTAQFQLQTKTLTLEFKFLKSGLWGQTHLQEAEFQWHSLSDPVRVSQAKGEIHLDWDMRPSYTLNDFEGTWQNWPFSAHLRAQKLPNALYSVKGFGKIQDYSLEVSSELNTPASLAWSVLLKHIDSKLQAEGVFNQKDAFNPPALVISSFKSHWASSGEWRLKEPFTLGVHPQAFELINGQAKAKGRLQWSAPQGLTIHMDIPSLNIDTPTIKGKISFLFAFEKTPQQPLSLFLEGKMHPGRFILKHSHLPIIKELPYEGGHVHLLLQDQHLKGNLFFKQNRSNISQGEIESIPVSQTPTRSWSDQKLQGQLSIGAHDLTFLPMLFPAISETKAKADIKLHLSGSLKSPSTQIEASLKEGTCFIAKQGLRLSKLALHASGSPKKLTLKGSGSAGNGSFTLEGQGTVNTAFTLNGRLKGKNLLLYNTPFIQMQVSPELTLNYADSLLNVQGTLYIPRASVKLQNDLHQKLLSPDVVLVKADTPSLAHRFKVVSELSLILEDTLHFKGYGIDGAVGGKLLIETRPDGLLSGQGKLTLQGKYRLQGATRYIEHGRLIFPKGTLLADPLLDIRISNIHTKQFQQTPDIGIYVQGTLQKPVFYPYSSDHLQNSEILSRLGFGRAESASEDQRRLLAQSAFLFSGTANPFIEALQAQLGLQEFNLEAQRNSTSNTSGESDTVFVVGKALSKRIYLQCLQNLLDPETTLKLKYLISPRFTLSLETGTDGPAGDLIFTTERD